MQRNQKNALLDIIIISTEENMMNMFRHLKPRRDELKAEKKQLISPNYNPLRSKVKAAGPEDGIKSPTVLNFLSL